MAVARVMGKINGKREIIIVLTSLILPGRNLLSMSSKLRTVGTLVEHALPGSDARGPKQLARGFWGINVPA
jgi:hypothetical protein